MRSRKQVSDTVPCAVTLNSMLNECPIRFISLSACSTDSTHLEAAVGKGASGQCIQEAKPINQRAPARTHIYRRPKEMRVVAGASLIIAFVS